MGADLHRRSGAGDREHGPHNPVLRGGRVAAPTVVSDGGHRRYTEDDLERLRLITTCASSGCRSARSGPSSSSGPAATARPSSQSGSSRSSRPPRAGAAPARAAEAREEGALDALASIQERLSSAGAEQCPCAVAEAARRAPHREGPRAAAGLLRARRAPPRPSAARGPPRGARGRARQARAARLAPPGRPVRGEPGAAATVRLR